MIKMDERIKGIWKLGCVGLVMNAYVEMDDGK